MRIVGLELFTVVLPLRREHVWAGNTRRSIGRHALVRVDTDEGVSGWGESPAIPTWGGDRRTSGGESPETVAALIRDYLFPALEGADPTDIAGVHERMDAVAKGAPYAKAALDIACMDIAGRSWGVPVHALLGGRRRAGVRVAQSLGLMPIDAAIAEAEAAVAEGITTIKIKTGVDGERDVRLVREVRRAVGSDVDLRTDANEGYASVAEAVRITKQQEEFRLLLCEQPVAGARGLAQVAAQIGTPVMADESAWTVRDIVELWQMGAAESFSCYTTKPGGLWRARRQAELAAELGMRHDIGGSGEFGIGVAANLHLGVAMEACELASVCPVPRLSGDDGRAVAGVFYLDDIIFDPPEYRDGELRCPEGPGLGVTVDEARVRHYSEGSLRVGGGR